MSNHYKNKYGDPNNIIRNKNINFLIEKDKKGNYLVFGNQDVLVLNNSDFFLEEAKSIREEVYSIIKERKDLRFHIKTKRLSLVLNEIPYDFMILDNVFVEVVVSNQFDFNKEVRALMKSKFKHKRVLIYPLYSKINIKDVLNDNKLELISLKGLEFTNKLVLKYEDVFNISEDTKELNIPFNFISTGALFEKDGTVFKVPYDSRYHQAFKSNLSHE